jgi:hypothetical protein
MNRLKLNRIIVLSFFALFNCTTKDSKNCDLYVGAGNGILISFKNYSETYSGKDLKHLKIYVKNRSVKYVREDLGNYLYANNYNIGLSNKILLKDTITIKIRGEIIKIYDFSNIIEEGFDQSHHKIKVCRYCKSTMNNQKMEDEGNNIIIVDFNKLSKN